MKPSLLVVARLPDALQHQLNTHFDCHHATQLDEASLAALAPRLRGIAANGESSVTRALIARLPALEIIAVFGVGYDGIDVEAAREHAVHVTHTPDVLTDDVADFAIALLLATARRVVSADRFVRRGQWPAGQYPLSTRVSGKRLGIVGLGRIGQAIAQRAAAFGMHLAYTGRSRKTDVSYAWFPDPQTLAANVDFLVVCAYGGPTTRALIDARVLQALGPNGLLINVARGSVIDETALVNALRENTIGGAGLDVFCHEPQVPAALFDLDNVVLTPHMASGTASTRQAMADLTFDNLDAHFSGRPLPTPVP
ncbi:2-hydroxyacid dehydrogenase [Paraburkholderia bonniea]|uniref:2-hydroxyacid dehydrogenase n=1 Tax=Paraburkholderia bonniea TaxID=2152891 RepID=UPI0012913095|nr:2-hydroxyacid dehydrogenase [Paraburkholderia bonniea]WJF89426.1 2-hydroxyacid dehydrogenase [Paraburkholderia bonniea]WJF92741.1 2-hydroxyacid dehydrogenase [Paraburkholderia bonniea]